MSFAGALTGGAGGDDQNPRWTLGKCPRQTSPPSRKLTKWGKGGRDNASCPHSSGKWVSEIRDPNCRSLRLWLGSYSTDRVAAIAYDNAAYKLYGAAAPLNFLDRIHRRAPAVPEVAPPPASAEMVQLSAAASSNSSSNETATTATVAEEGDEEFWRDLEDLPDWEAMGKFPWA